MEKKINLDSIIDDGFNLYMLTWMKEAEYRERFIKDAMLEFGRQLLELASENAECEVDKNYDIFINKQSILDTLKQAE